MINQHSELRELLLKLNLDPLTETSHLRVSLRQLIASSHADKTGGSFASPDQEATFHAAKSALELVDRRSSGTEANALVVIGEAQRALVESQRMMMDLLRAEREAATTAKEGSVVEVAEQRAVRAVATASSRRFRPARIGSWSIAGLSALIVMLDKPLGGLIAEITGAYPNVAQQLKLILASVAVYGALLGWIVLQIEAYKNQHVKAATSDQGIREIIVAMLRARSGKLAGGRALYLMVSSFRRPSCDGPRSGIQ